MVSPTPNSLQGGAILQQDGQAELGTAIQAYFEPTIATFVKRILAAVALP